MSFTVAQFQSDSDFSISSTTVDVVLTSVAAGSLIAAWVKHEGAPTTITVSDGTNTLSAGTKHDHTNGDLSGQWHYLLVSGSGSITITATLGAARQYKRIHAYVATYTAGSIVLDDEAIAGGSSTAPSSGNLTTTGTDGIAFGGYGEHSAETPSSPTINGGAADGSNLNSPSGEFTSSWHGDYTAGFTGTAACTLSGSGDWVCGAIAFMAGAGFSREQEGFRWRDDDGSESAASWLAAQDTNIARAVTLNTRLRMLVNATGDPTTAQYRLDYKKSTDSVYVAVPLSATVPGTVDAEITLGTDDAQQIGTTMTLTGTTIGGSLDAITDWVGLRFQSIAIPVGATITVAHISVVPTSTTEDEPLVTVYLEDADSPGTFTTGASDISARTRTTGVAWSSTNLGATGTSYHNSPSLVADVQAVVDRVGWASGNAMVVIIQGGATSTRDLTIKSFENVGATPPLLHVEYTIPAPIHLSASANIAASGEATTAQLTAPSGKTTGDFVAGRIQDDENPADTVDITTDDYTELEWCLTAQTGVAVDAEVYQFRVTVGGTPLDTYTVTPTWTIGAGGGGGGFQAAWAARSNAILGARRAA